MTARMLADHSRLPGRAGVFRETTAQHSKWADIYLPGSLVRFGNTAHACYRTWLCRSVFFYSLPCNWCETPAATSALPGATPFHAPTAAGHATGGGVQVSGHVR